MKIAEHRGNEAMKVVAAAVVPAIPIGAIALAILLKGPAAAAYAA